MDVRTSLALIIFAVAVVAAVLLIGKIDKYNKHKHSQ